MAKPTPHNGPRRFDLNRHGIVWTPAYAANLLVRFDPAARRFTEIPLPIRDAVPYIVRDIVRADPRSGALWIGTGASPGIPARIARVQRR